MAAAEFFRSLHLTRFARFAWCSTPYTFFQRPPQKLNTNSVANRRQAPPTAVRCVHPSDCLRTNTPPCHGPVRYSSKQGPLRDSRPYAVVVHISQRGSTARATHGGSAGALGRAATQHAHHGSQDKSALRRQSVRVVLHPLDMVLVGLDCLGDAVESLAQQGPVHYRCAGRLANPIPGLNNAGV